MNSACRRRADARMKHAVACVYFCGRDSNGLIVVVVVVVKAAITVPDAACLIDAQVQIACMRTKMHAMLAARVREPLGSIWHKLSLKSVQRLRQTRHQSVPTHRIAKR